MIPNRPGMVMLPLRPSAPVRSSDSIKATVLIYKPFFVCGILTVLTVGCLLGALALLGISRQGSYTASNWTPYVLAHANSQLFGWVGFFVMGFAMQQHGTTIPKANRFHAVAYGALATMGMGIVLRFAAEPLSQVDPIRWNWLGISSGILQIVAVALFCYNTGVNRHPNGEKMTWPTSFVFASLFCLLVVAIAEPWVFINTHQLSQPDSVAFIVQWLTPLRETQFLGFVAMMIFGVAASKFPGCLGFKDTRKSWGLTALVLWCLGLVSRIAGWLQFSHSSFLPGTDNLFRFGGILLLLGAISMSVCLRVFEATRNSNSSQKFLRAAFGWLIIAGILLVMEPLHLRAIGAPFSHAYTGGIRHAVTVGFISQMIIGVGYHLVTRMAMIPSENAPQLLSVFLLMNIGNTARVALEIMTDYQHSAYAPMGFTGFVELTGLAIWGTVMLKIIARRQSTYAASC